MRVLNARQVIPPWQKLEPGRPEDLSGLYKFDQGCPLSYFTDEMQDRLLAGGLISREDIERSIMPRIPDRYPNGPG